MSAEMWAYCQQTGSQIAKLLLIALAKNLDTTPHEKFLIADLAEFCECTEFQVARAIGVLCEKGLLTRVFHGIDLVDPPMPSGHYRLNHVGTVTQNYLENAVEIA